MEKYLLLLRLIFIANVIALPMTYWFVSQVNFSKGERGQRIFQRDSWNYLGTVTEIRIIKAE